MLPQTEFLYKHGIDKFYSNEKKYYNIDEWISKNYRILQDKIVALSNLTWLLGIFEFKPDKIRYAVLYTLHDNKIYVERLVKRNNQEIFELINDEAEWQIAVYFVRNFTKLLDPEHITQIYYGPRKND